MRQIPRVAAVTLDKSQLDVPFTKVNQTGQVVLQFWSIDRLVN